MAPSEGGGVERGGKPRDGQQVACRDAEALNGALLVRGDDASEEIKFRKDRYLTTVKMEGAVRHRGRHRVERTRVRQQSLVGRSEMISSRMT